jgi:hypothetical protein
MGAPVDDAGWPRVLDSLWIKSWSRADIVQVLCNWCSGPFAANGRQLKRKTAIVARENAKRQLPNADRAQQNENYIAAFM